MAILKVWSPRGWNKDGEGRRDPDDQPRGLWYRTTGLVVAAAIWMALLGLLYLYFINVAPQELRERIQQEERLSRVLHLDAYRLAVLDERNLSKSIGRR